MRIVLTAILTIFTRISLIIFTRIPYKLFESRDKSSGGIGKKYSIILTDSDQQINRRRIPINK